MDWCYKTWSGHLDLEPNIVVGENHFAISVKSKTHKMDTVHHTSIIFSSCFIGYQQGYPASPGAFSAPAAKSKPPVK